MDEKEVKGKLLRVGIVRPHKTEYLIKNLLGNEPYAIMPTQKQILKSLKTLVECGKDFAIDFAIKKQQNECEIQTFWQVSLRILYRCLIFVMLNVIIRSCNYLCTIIQ